MTLIENTLFGKIDKEKIAIERIIVHQQKDIKYTVGISGGKDSTVIYDLVKKSGVDADYIHNFTTIDAPQTYKFIRKNYPDVKFIHPKIKPLPAMMLKWKEPPTMIWRMCCRYYKETYYGNERQFLITGIRAEESTKRKGKRLLESCYRKKTKRYLNIIIDWSTYDVWEYIKKYKLPYNPLYDPPYNVKRIGCVLCPCAKTYDEAMKIAPKIVDTWKRWMVRLWHEGKKNGWAVAKHHESPEELWNWWLGDKIKYDPNQMNIFED